MTDEPLYDERGSLVPPGDRAQVLRDRMAAGYPSRWDPAAGDTIVGVIARTAVGHMPINGDTRILVLVVDGVELAVWLKHEGLRAKLEESGAVVGETVAIQYIGPPVPPSRAHRYQVTVDRPAGAAVDWSKPAGGRVEAGGDGELGRGAPAASTEPPASTVPPAQPEPVQASLVDDEACPRCRAVGGHQVGCPNDPAAARCSECGWTGGVHQPGCSGIPY